MAKLYPPYIEGTIPAFFVNGSSAYLTVPFSMNKAVSKAEFSAIAIKIKTVQTNEYIYSATTRDADRIYIKNSFKAPFDISLSQYSKFKAGQYYKVQIAYVDNSGIVGYYSTVAIVKLTTKPKVTIADLATGTNIASSRLHYTGVYQQLSDTDADMDVSEKVNEYCFNLYEVSNVDSSSSLVATSGWQLHNSSTDIVSYESTDQYSFTYSLKPNRYYQVEYIIRTINGLEISSGKYTIMDKVGVAPEIKATFYYEVNFDNGYIDLKLQPDDNEHDYANGAFLLTRASDEDDYSNWYELARFSLRNSDKLTAWNFKDFTVEHGKKYIYSLQQYNSKGLYSTRLYAIDLNTHSKYAIADFEDAFLYDGKRQLKVRFNPKVSSFKTDKLEQKVETIGSQYPFIFRNARVSYKEFPISGLISYQSDQDQFFMTAEELGLNEDFNSKTRSELTKTPSINWDDSELRPYTTTFESYNIYAERLFKLQVLDWLNNGEVKLFKSPVEGNYLVRLMNVSLSPEDRLGRMLHNFSATAYEMNDCSYKNLNYYGIIDVTETEDIQYRLMTLDLSTAEVKQYYQNSTVVGEELAAAQAAQQQTIANLQDQLTDARAAETRARQADALNHTDETFEAYLQAHNRIKSLEDLIAQASQEADQLASSTRFNRYNPYDIYEYIEFRDCLPGTTFWIFDVTTGSEFSVTIGVTGSYKINLEEHIFSSIRLDSSFDVNEVFGLITFKYLAATENNFEQIYDVALEQIVARQFIGGLCKDNIIDEITDDVPKRKLISLYYTNFTAKPISYIYNSGTNIYQWDESGRSLTECRGRLMSEDELSPLYMYKVYTGMNSYQYKMWQGPEKKWSPPQSNIDYSITVDGNKMMIELDHESEVLSHLIQFFNDQAFTELKLGNGIILDCSYTASVATYNIESVDPELISMMEDYMQALENYNNPELNIYHSSLYYEQVVQKAWDDYCDTLKSKL